jgi:hypothetical protein
VKSVNAFLIENCGEVIGMVTCLVSGERRIAFPSAAHFDDQHTTRTKEAEHFLGFVGNISETGGEQDW